MTISHTTKLALRAYRNSAYIAFTAFQCGNSPFSLKGANPRQCAAPASERPRNAPNRSSLARNNSAPRRNQPINALHRPIGSIALPHTRRPARQRGRRVEQLTIDGYCDRLHHIDRLTRSLAKWRAQELDRILPDEYERFCSILAHLQAGGEYTVQRASPEQYHATGSTGAPGVDELFRDVAAGFAHTSRTWRMKRRNNNRKRPRRCW